MDYLSLIEKSDLNMDLKILNISCSPGDVLVKFQGQYMSDCEFDYHILQKEIQLVQKVNEDIGIGAFCLAQDKPFGEWYRGKIWDKVKQTFEVALIDVGNVVKVGLPQIALASGELFTLPPKVVNGIFSNLLPLEEKWTLRAVNYFSSLAGQQLSGHVQIFLPHQVVVLQVPKVIGHAIEFSLARYVDSDSFCLLVEIIQKVPANSHCKQMPDLLPQKQSPDISFTLHDNLPRFQKILDHLRPDICVGTMEKIKISAAVSPDRFYCLILSWEEALNKLTASMCSHYGTVQTRDSSAIGSFGVVCAAQRRDGIWCRGIIQTLISVSEVKVWFIDVGSSETISSSCVQKLEPEFLSLPMMAIPCALSPENDHIDGVKNGQLALFKEALMGHIVIAYLNNFCSDRRLFFISLYDKEYELSTSCHLTNKEVPFFSPNSYTDVVKSEYDAKEPEIVLPKASSLNQEETISFKSIQMDLESVHVVYVEYVLNPSDFWVRTDDCQIEFSAMMAEIAEQYTKCELMEMVMEDPKPGQLCCAVYSKDRHYYRAVITEVFHPQICVYFIDFGNTEMIPFYDVKILLPHFSVLPALAMCCTLAHAYPLEDVWINSANDYFKEIVVGKELLCHVLTKQKYKYVVELRLLDNSESSDIVSLLVQAGYAELWKINLNSSSLNSECSSPEKGTKCEKKVISSVAAKSHKPKADKDVTIGTWTLKLKTTETKFSFCAPPNDCLAPSVTPICYKQYIFTPGAIMDVRCCHVESPGNFWCQMSDNLPKLDSLMDNIQRLYLSCSSRYQHGQIACIAKSSGMGKYCRAAVVKQVSRNRVNVVFVDYGNSESVLVSELREIKAELLDLEGQAFRCCLSNVLSPSHTQHTWSGKACEDFKIYVGSAAPDVMKCTIVALLTTGSGDLCNAINLETSCGHANQLLASEGHLVLRGKVPPIHLHTFCYSSFDIELGRAEGVYVTYVYSTGMFYCQFAKNDQIFDMLMKRVFKLSEKIKSEIVNGPKELCLVKYNHDGNFYRALACPIESSSMFIAFFVDFGDSQVVKSNELLPIPEKAADVLFQPMQAIPCYLSGLKGAHLTTEAKAWFEEQCVGKLLNAVVVSRDNEGHLELELCSGSISVNKKIKELLCLHSLQEETSVSLVTRFNTAKPDICGGVDTIKDHSQIQKSDCQQAKNTCKASTLSDFNGNEIPFKQDKFMSDNSIDTLFRNALQKATFCDSVGASKPRNDIHVMTSTQWPINRKELVTCIDLPQIDLEAGENCLVYISHVNNLSNFYLQLAENENQIMQLGEDLNNMSFQTIDSVDLVQGVLVVAQYPDDNLYYRAEIKEILQDRSFKVEFIDYGNAAHVDSSCVFKIPEKFCTIPKLSVSVFLTGVQKLQSSGEWGEKVVENFCEIVSNEPFNCEFLCKHDTWWEVNIIFKGKSISKELLKNFGSPLKQSTGIKKDSISKSELSYFHVSSKTLREETSMPTTNKIIHEYKSLKLKAGQIEKVKHMYVSNCGMLFVTLTDFSDGPKLKHQITANVQKDDNHLFINQMLEGMPCLAKSEVMQNWFRAIIEEVFRGKMKIAVFFVDNGAREVISGHNVKMLTPEELIMPKQAVACIWVQSDKIGENVFKTQIRSILQKEVQVIFLEFLEAINAWNVEILVNGILLLRYFDRTLHQGENKWRDTGSQFYLNNILSPPIRSASLKLLQAYPGYVTLFQDPSNFFVQLGDSFDTMAHVSQLIKILPHNPLPLTVDSLRAGSHCMVKCFAETEWCRTEIVGINMTSILLYLFDFGIYKSIPYSDVGQLKRIPDELVSLPSTIYHCMLHDVIPQGGACWSKEAILYFIQFVQNRDLIILPITSAGKNITAVILYGDGDLAHKLVSTGLAIHSDPKRKSAEGAVNSSASTHLLPPRSNTEQYLQDAHCSESSTFKEFSTLKAKLNSTDLQWNQK
ncbi:tudor domain-containing protein 15 [Pseudophryne corroboree]|uniref:tudor domain-containing protein 15 n=1 Tax=Pseudophryne corroboree TaxID=495146 RepID=UPI003081360F